MKNTETKTETIVVDIPLQASNIDERGNVLYLDEERLARKKVGFRRHKNKSDGLGIYNFIIANITHLNPKKWKIAKLLYKIFVKYAPWMKQGGFKAKLYKKVTKIYPDMEKNTGSIVMPLNVDVSRAGEKVTVPMDMLKETLKKVDYIAGMDTCLCRQSNDCKDYPKDLACLFLGEPGRSITKHGLGRELTYEEACARIDKAASLGLMAQAVWIEFEQPLWGVPNGEMDNFLEVCFCCPCCCVAMQLSSNLTEKERVRFHPSGWTAVPDRTRCVGCGRCVTVGRSCPVEAISLDENKKVVINQETCLGCGLCVDKCKLDVIKIKQTMPMREDIGEYFDEEFNVGLRIWKDEERNRRLSSKE